MNLPEINSDMRIKRKHYQQVASRLHSLTPEQKYVSNNMKKSVILNLDYQNSYKLTPKQLKKEFQHKDIKIKDQLPSIKSNISKNIVDVGFKIPQNLHSNVYNERNSNESLQLPK